MKRRRCWSGLITLSTAVFLVGCASAAGDSDDGAQDAVVADETAVARVINVETISVEPTEFTEFIRITGEAEAFHDIVLSAEEGGVIAEFLLEKGSRVRAGQVIARIDSRSLIAQVDEATASAALAREQFERQRRLWEDEGMGTEIAFLQSKYQADIAHARLQNLQIRLTKTEITSPVDGVFDYRFVEAGEIALPGTQVARIVSIDRIKIMGGVPERYAAVVGRGDRANIRFDIFPDRDFSGIIQFVGSTVDEQNRTFPIEITIRNPSGLVKPQMVANVQLVREDLTNVVVASQDVIRRSEDGYHVFVVEEVDGETFAAAKPVRLGASAGNQVVIESGLDVGDRLITLGSQLVDDGSRVRVVSGSTETPVSEGQQ